MDKRETCVFVHLLCLTRSSDTLLICFQRETPSRKTQPRITRTNSENQTLLHARTHRVRAGTATTVNMRMEKMSWREEKTMVIMTAILL